MCSHLSSASCVCEWSSLSEWYPSLAESVGDRGAGAAAGGELSCIRESTASQPREKLISTPATGLGETRGLERQRGKRVQREKASDLKHEGVIKSKKSWNWWKRKF